MTTVQKGFFRVQTKTMRKIIILCKYNAKKIIESTTNINEINEKKNTIHFLCR